MSEYKAFDQLDQLIQQAKEVHMKRCPNDHLVIRPDKFCSECGTELIEVESKKCPNCAGAVSEIQNYCSVCGTKLKA